MWSYDDVSDRKARLPSDWYHKDGTRNRILDRDRHACQWPIADRICAAHATHVDHKRCGTTGSVSDDELWSLCEPHHVAKTASEGGRATAQRYRRRPRHVRVHPGLVEP